MSKAKYGILCITSDRLRTIYRTFLKHCTGCSKSTDKGGEYTHELGDPRIMDLMGVENPLWHTISADIVGPWNFSQFQDARGRNSRFKLHGLFICDLANFLVNVILMDGAMSSDVVKAIATFCS